MTDDKITKKKVQVDKFIIKVTDGYKSLVELSVTHASRLFEKNKTKKR